MTIFTRFLTALVAAMVTVSALAQVPGIAHSAYPVARKDKTVDAYFGVKVPAPYQWMETLTSPDLHKWVAAENKLTSDYMAHVPVRAWIDRHLITLWNYAKETVPTQLADGTVFFSRNSGLESQSVVYVRTSPDAEARVLLDPNKLSPDGSIALLAYVPSPNGEYLAYTLSKGGSNWQTIHVMNVATGKQLSHPVRWVKFSGISWTNDDRGFYYSRYPEPPAGEKAIAHAVTGQKLYYHRLGTSQTDDRLVFAPRVPYAEVEGQVSEDGHYLFLTIENSGNRKNALYYADLGNARKPDVVPAVKPLYTKSDAAYAPIGNIGDTLYLRTTFGAPNGRVVAAKLATPSPDKWRVVVPGTHDVLNGALLVDGDVLANYLDVAKSELKLFSTRGKLLHVLNLPTLGTVGNAFGGGISGRKDSKYVYYGFTSFLYPTTVYRYDVADDRTTVFFKPRVKFDAAPYETKQVFYTSKDGTSVPMFIVAKKGIKLDGSHPTVLYGYGGFGIPITPTFSPMLPVWLEMGGVYAVANIRGGGVYGEAWHQAGMLGNKQNVFDDFAWAAKYLIKQGYTSSRHLGIQGYSNGGLLTGASIIQHPHMFGAAFIGHGLLDMLRYQKFSGAGFWVSEYGSSSNEKAFRWLIKYSPLQNIHPGTCYPPTFITTSWDDDTVVPSHEFKFTARIQQAQGCDNPILLQTTSSTSHGYMPTKERIRQEADVWAFEAYSLGIRQLP